MSSTYPAPPASAPSLAAGAGASAQDPAINGASQASPQLGQESPAPAYQHTHHDLSDSPHQQLAAHQEHHYQSHLDHDHASAASLGADAAGAADAATIAAAHHGLEVLQAATITPNQGQETVSQYSPPTTGLGTQSYQVSSGAGTPTQPKATTKATRLRRACDMCSSRKVKVSFIRSGSGSVKPRKMK